MGGIALNFPAGGYGGSLRPSEQGPLVTDQILVVLRDEMSLVGQSLPKWVSRAMSAFPLISTAEADMARSKKCQHRKWVSFDHRPLVQTGSTQSQCRAPGATSTG